MCNNISQSIFNEIGPIERHLITLSVSSCVAHPLQTDFKNIYLALACLMKKRIENFNRIQEARRRMAKHYKKYFLEVMNNIVKVKQITTVLVTLFPLGKYDDILDQRAMLLNAVFYIAFISINGLMNLSTSLCLFKDDKIGQRS